MRDEKKKRSSSRGEEDIEKEVVHQKGYGTGEGIRDVQVEDGRRTQGG